MTHLNVEYPIVIGERVIGIRVAINRYLGDDPQPGIVECAFVDANGKRHLFIEKTAIVTSDYLDSKSAYPRSGVIACKIVRRYRDDSSREVIVVNTRAPWGVESTEELEEFSVLPGSLVQWEYGTTTERKWDGIA
jgi:hypothetical protein